MPELVLLFGSHSGTGVWSWDWLRGGYKEKRTVPHLQGYSLVGSGTLLFT